jgi:hypothetical protein
MRGMEGTNTKSRNGEAQRQGSKGEAGAPVRKDEVGPERSSVPERPRICTLLFLSYIHRYPLYAVSCFEYSHG